jgi:hypothetical protein
MASHADFTLAVNTNVRCCAESRRPHAASEANHARAGSSAYAVDSLDAAFAKNAGAGRLRTNKTGALARHGHGFTVSVSACSEHAHTTGGFI